MTPRTTARRPGFSMFELLVVLAILGFLLAILLPLIEQMRQRAARTQTQNGLKMMGLATHSHNDAYRRMPPAFDKFGGMPAPQSVHVYLLPFVEQAALYQQYLKNEVQNDVAVGSYTSPNDPSHPQPPAGIQNFAANLRVFSTKGERTQADAAMPKLGAVEPGQPAIPRTFPDGTSNTLLFVTRYGVCGKGGSRYASAPDTNTAAMFGQNPATAQARPADVTGPFLVHPGVGQCQPTPLMGHSFNTSGIDVGMADGSSRVITTRISAETWNNLVQPNDGNVLGKDFE